MFESLWKIIESDAKQACAMLSIKLKGAMQQMKMKLN